MAAITAYGHTTIGVALQMNESNFDPDRYAHRDAKTDCSGLEIMGHHRGAFADVPIFDIPTPGKVEDLFVAKLELEAEEELGNDIEAERKRGIVVDDEYSRMAIEAGVVDTDDDGADRVQKIYAERKYRRRWSVKKVRRPNSTLAAWAERAEDDDEIAPIECRSVRRAAKKPCEKPFSRVSRRSWKVAPTGQKARHQRASHQWARHECRLKSSWQERWGVTIGEQCAMWFASQVRERDIYLTWSRAA